MNIKEAKSIVGRANAKKKWDKYKTPEQRRKLLKKAHEARRKKAKEKRENKAGDNAVDTIK